MNRFKPRATSTSNEYLALKEYGVPYITEKFTGPYWSDGKLQNSVAYSKEKPTSKLDWKSRQHDYDYAVARTYDDLTKADVNYYNSTRGMSFVPNVIGTIPLLLNAPKRFADKLINGDRLPSVIDLGEDSVITSAQTNDKTARMERFRQRLIAKEVNQISKDLPRLEQVPEDQEFVPPTIGEDLPIVSDSVVHATEEKLPEVYDPYNEGAQNFHSHAKNDCIKMFAKLFGKNERNEPPKNRFSNKIKKKNKSRSKVYIYA